MGNPTGDKLKKIQQMLNKVSKPKPFLEENGQWSEAVSKALMNLQVQAKIKVSGVVDTETAVIISRYMKSGKIEKDQPIHYVKSGSTLLGFTQKDYDRAERKVRYFLLRGVVAQLSGKAIKAESIWTTMAEANSKQWFVSFCLQEIGAPKLPSFAYFIQAKVMAAYMENLARSGSLLQFFKELPKAEKTVNKAVSIMNAYYSAVTGAASITVTSLKIVKTSSFIFLGVFAAPVAATAFGTGALASAVIGNAAVAFVESSSSELGKGAAGEKGWTFTGALKNTVIDTGVGGLIGVFDKGGKGGIHIFESAVLYVSKKTARNEGFKFLGKQTVKKVTVYMITEGAKGATESAIKDVAKVLKGDPNMSLSKAADNIGGNFVKSGTLGVMGTTIAKYTSKKIPSKYTDKIWDLVLKDVSKSSSGLPINLSDITNKTQDLVASLIAKSTSSNIDWAVSKAIDKASGPLSSKKFEALLIEQLFGPSEITKLAAFVTKAVKKDILAERKSKKK